MKATHMQRLARWLSQFTMAELGGQGRCVWGMSRYFWM